jgi:hypothetical protein
MTPPLPARVCARHAVVYGLTASSATPTMSVGTRVTAHSSQNGNVAGQRGPDWLPDGTEDETLNDAPKQRLTPRTSLTEPALDDDRCVASVPVMDVKFEVAAPAATPALSRT